MYIIMTNNVVMMKVFLLCREKVTSLQNIHPLNDRMTADQLSTSYIL